MMFKAGSANFASALGSPHKGLQFIALPGDISPEVEKHSATGINTQPTP
jgi:hypothetical protein